MKDKIKMEYVGGRTDLRLPGHGKIAGRGTTVLVLPQEAEDLIKAGVWRKWIPPKPKETKKIKGYPPTKHSSRKG
jgi:hypothetical protein